jgi:hypothetical protein
MHKNQNHENESKGPRSQLKAIDWYNNNLSNKVGNFHYYSNYEMNVQKSILTKKKSLNKLIESNKYMFFM